MHSLSARCTMFGDVTVTGKIVANYQDVAEWVSSPQMLRSITVVAVDTSQSNQVNASYKQYDIHVASYSEAGQTNELGSCEKGMHQC